MQRIRQGLHLARASWGVLRGDRSLVAFSFAAVISAVVAFNGVTVVFVAIAAAVQVKWLIIPGLVVAAYAAIFCAISCSVALAGAVQLSLTGRDTHFSDGWAVAKKRRKVIARWAAVQLAVGLVLTAVNGARGGSAGSAVVRRLAGAMIGMGWSVATFFVVPLIALEGPEPGEAVRKSVHLVKKTWGEALSGSSGIGLAVAVVAAVPVLGLFSAAGAVQPLSSVWGGVLDFVAFTALIAACTIGSTLSTIFRIELFRFSNNQHATGGFRDEDMVTAFI